MKKILILLSILTVSGTAVQTTIAASTYEKQEKLNSSINYPQTNNLENLNRNKREINYNKITTKQKNISGSISNYGVVLNNKLYFWSSFGVISRIQSTNK